jgi:hypothetical protein
LGKDVPAHPPVPKMGNCLAMLKQQNRKDRKDREDRKEKLLRGLCGLRGSNSNSRALFGTRFTDG